jgi:hypothetical protein
MGSGSGTKDGFSKHDNEQTTDDYVTKWIKTNTKNKTIKKKYIKNTEEY